MPLFHNFTAKRRKQAASEKQAIELFGSCGSDEGDIEEDVGRDNVEEREEKEEEEEEEKGSEKEGDR